MNIHNTVLLNEAVSALAIKPNGIYVDATFGRGGHSKLILDELGAKGQLFAIDKDVAAIEFGHKTFEDKRLTFIHSDFADLSVVFKNHHLMGKIDGVLLDLGVSSPQLDDKNRGFSFMKNGPLDMRMNQTTGLSAAQWLQQAEENEIADVLWQYGQERKSRQIAKEIVAKRIKRPLETTLDLVDCVKKVLKKTGKKHPATRTFQAIRIFINQELQAIKKLLSNANDLLKIGGHLVVISFHSLEDKLVKTLFSPKMPHIPKEIPLQPIEVVPIFKTIGKKIKPSFAEIQNNPRSRSAIMRTGVKVR